MLGTTGGRGAFAGKIGVGKTTIAVQLFHQMKSDSTLPVTYEGVIEGCLNSSDPLVLYNNIRSFCIEQRLELPSYAKFQRQTDGIIYRVLQELFDTLERRFPCHLKCLIFDDAAPTTNIIHLLDNIHKKIALNKLWKIVVTTDDCHMDLWLGRTNDVAEIGVRFRMIEEFNNEEAAKFLESLKIEASLQASLLERLKGHPLSLKVIKEILHADHVSAYQ